MPSIRSTAMDAARSLTIVRSLIAAAVLLSSGRAVVAAPFPVADINLGHDAYLSSDPQNLVVAGRLTYFTAASGLGPHTIPQQLWRTDGTAAGTFAVSDFATKPGFALDLRGMTAVGEKLFFLRDTRELWVTEGTLASTRLVRAFDQELTMRATEFRGQLYFVARETATGRELWRSDGTAQGTVMVVDLEPGGGDGIQQLGDLHVSGDRLYFASAYEDGSPTSGELWVTDGTAAGTHIVSDLRPGEQPSSPFGLVDVGGKTLVRTDLGFGRQKLWATEGTAETTVGLAELAADELTSAGDYAVFFPYDESVGREPWVTDGTPEGTKLLLDFNPGPDSSLACRPYCTGYVAAAGGLVYFAAATPTTEWRSRVPTELPKVHGWCAIWPLVRRHRRRLSS